MSAPSKHHQWPDMSETSRLVRLYRDALQAEDVDATDEQAARRLPRVVVKVEATS